MNPIYRHDCDECQFLGTYALRDLYFCRKQQVGGATLLARASDDPPDYISGLQLALAAGKPSVVSLPDWLSQKPEGLTALRVAYLLAVDVGLLSGEPWR